MKNISIVLLMVILCLGTSVLAQQEPPPGDPNDPNAKQEGAVNAKFAQMTKEAGVVCGQLLPAGIPGIDEIMPLCGGRAAVRASKKLFLEGSLIQGAAKAQRYMMGSFSFRSDFGLDDFVASVFAGADISYVTSPVYNQTPTGEDTRIYMGLHAGGAIWWEFNESMSLRTDLKFNFNPGSSLFVAIGLVLRFDPVGGEAQQAGQQ